MYYHHQSLLYKAVVIAIEIYIFGVLSKPLKILHTAMDVTPLIASKLYKRFNQVFQELENLGDEYKTKLKPDAKPFALFTP